MSYARVARLHCDICGAAGPQPDLNKPLPKAKARLEAQDYDWFFVKYRYEEFDFCSEKCLKEFTRWPNGHFEDERR